VRPSVIDASVAAKWFFEEEHSAEARALLVSDVRHIAPDFILTEFASTALKRVRRGDISADDARRACLRLPTMLFLRETPPLVAAALELALAFERSVYDSLYIALASLLETQLVTADRRLFNALIHSLPRTMLWIGDMKAEEP
jgi:predicted nucleic acid-binding protein